MVKRVESSKWGGKRVENQEESAGNGGEGEGISKGHGFSYAEQDRKQRGLVGVHFCGR